MWESEVVVANFGTTFLIRDYASALYVIMMVFLCQPQLVTERVLRNMSLCYELIMVRK